MSSMDSITFLTHLLQLQLHYQATKNMVGRGLKSIIVLWYYLRVLGNFYYSSLRSLHIVELILDGDEAQQTTQHRFFMFFSSMIGRGIAARRRENETLNFYYSPPKSDI